MGIDELGVDEMGEDEMGSRQSGMTPLLLHRFTCTLAVCTWQDWFSHDLVQLKLANLLIQTLKILF